MGGIAHTAAHALNVLQYPAEPVHAPNCYCSFIFFNASLRLPQPWLPQSAWSSPTLWTTHLPSRPRSPKPPTNVRILAAFDPIQLNSLIIFSDNVFTTSIRNLADAAKALHSSMASQKTALARFAEVQSLCFAFRPLFQCLTYLVSRL
jgi:hypothetical protein